MSTKSWDCRIGFIQEADIPVSADLHLRSAVASEYMELTGKSPAYVNSGWVATDKQGNPPIISVEEAAPVQREALRHPGSAKYHRLLVEAGATHDRKQQDYGTSHDPFANLRASSDFAVEPWRATLVRMNDKWSRLKSFSQKGDLANESVRDSLMDIAVYSLICIVLMEDEADPSPNDGMGL